MTILKTISIGLACAVAAVGSAGAADYGPIMTGAFLQTAPEIKPVEFGTGWYLRGDLGYEAKTDFDGTARFVRSPVEAELPFGRLTLDDGFTGGGGIGYRFTDTLRSDVTARYGQHDFSATIGTPAAFCAGVACASTLSGDARTWELMVNAYVDLGTFAGFTPYVGGGLGAVNLDFTDIDGSFCTTAFGGAESCETPAVSGDDDWRFAYNLSAGLAYDINRSLALDIGYRYLNVEGGRLGTSTIGTTTTTGEDDGYDRHTVTAGVRYSLW